MSRFTETMLNENYLKIYTKNKAIIFVEDQGDTFFWTEIFKKKSGGYKIFPIVSYANANGKQELNKLIPKLNSHLYIALDSDYDYIKNQNSFNNKYIFHTYFYSRESYEYDKENILSCISKMLYQNNLESYYENFIDEYSKHCFNVISAFMFLHKTGISFKIKEFHSFLKFKSNEFFYINDNYSNIILTKKNNFNQYVQSKYGTVINFQSNGYLNHINELNIIGINENNAYKFIKGHILEETIDKFIREYKSLLMKSEISYAKIIYPPGTPRNQEIAKLVRYFENFSAYTLIKRFNLDWSCTFLTRVHQDIFHKT